MPSVLQWTLAGESARRRILRLFKRGRRRLYSNFQRQSRYQRRRGLIKTGDEAQSLIRLSTEEKQHGES
jgi:hypothetical protein